MIEKIVELFKIGARMKQAGLSDSFIDHAIETAARFEGIYDLMILWRDENSIRERNEIVADIQELIDDCAI